MKGLEEGAKAPAFSLPVADGTTVSLADFRGRNLVLYFYPRADTPGCTIEAKEFTRLLPRFERAGTAVLGVSADPIKAQQRFAAKHKLLVTLASDETHAMLEAYEAWGKKSMFGVKYLGVFRKTVLIGKDGRIARIWPKVTVKGHAEEVLAAAQAL